MADFFVVPVGGCRRSWRESGHDEYEMNENKHSAAAVCERAGRCCTCEVISVHSVEQQEANKEDKTDAGDYHSTQQEAVAAFSLDDLGMRWKH